MNTMKLVLRTLAKGLRAMSEEVGRMEQVIDKLEEKTSQEAKVIKKSLRRSESAQKIGGRQPREGTATSDVFSIIKSTRAGVDTETLKKKTGFPEKKIWNIINRLKREGKIRATKRGVYVRS